MPFYNRVLCHEAVQTMPVGGADVTTSILHALPTCVDDGNFGQLLLHMQREVAHAIEEQRGRILLAVRAPSVSK